MIKRATANRWIFVFGCLINLFKSTFLYSAVIVTRLDEPTKVFGTPWDFPVDIDGDGAADFSFNLQSTFQLTLEPILNGMMMGRADIVVPLASGFFIGPELESEIIVWKGRSVISACAAFSVQGKSTCIGEFFGLDAYIGIQFLIEGKIHYGWIRFRHSAIIPMGWIVEWAYESTPGVPIYAGLKGVPISNAQILRPGYLRLTWFAEIGRIYQFQARPSMSAMNWTNLSFSVPATSRSMMIDLPVRGDARFFRVLEVE